MLADALKDSKQKSGDLANEIEMLPHVTRKFQQLFKRSLVHL